MERKKSHDEVYAIKAWFGTARDLINLAEIINSQFGEQRDAHTASVKGQLDKEHRILVRLPLVGRRTRRDHEEKLQQSIDSFTVRIVCRDANGDSVALAFKELTPEDEIFRTAHRVAIGMDGGTDTCLVRFSKDGALRNQLAVSGPPGWAFTTKSTIVRAINDKRPAWWIIRDLRFYAPIAVLFSIALIGIGATRKHIAFTVIYFIAAYVLPFFGWWVIGKIFPSFEIQDPDRPNIRRRWSRAAGVIGGILVTLSTIGSAIYTFIKK
jgi:hypothetical protein